MKPYQAILALICYYLLQIVIAPAVSMDYYIVVSSIIAIIAFGWLLHKKQMLPLSSRDLKGSQLFFCFGIGLGLALFSKLSVVLGVLSGAPITEMLLPNGFLWIPTVVVLGPVAEELVYRGILFGSFSRSFSYKIAIVLSTALFLPGHNLISGLSVFVVGVLLAWIYWRTDNLAVTMVIHGIINLGTFLSAPLYFLLATNRTLGIMAGLLMVLLGIGITYLCTKKFLQKHDALPDRRNTAAISYGR